MQTVSFLRNKFLVMDYNQYRYIYPPRPENKIAPESLKTFDDMNIFLGQPKLNGSSMQIYTDGNTVIVMNRHKQILSHKMDIEELKSLHRGNGWMVLCGEYMNKAQKDETGKLWNNKFVIFDVIVLFGKHLLSMTFEERYELLRGLYPDNPVKKYLHQISENCFRVHSIRNEFTEAYKDMTQFQMYEGLVLKKRDGKLEMGTTEQNNVRTQLKCRKSTKNYIF
jgi:hypothetical protein